MKGNEEEEEETTLVVRIIMETEDEKDQAGRPNAYWAQVRAEQASDPDNFGGSFRGVKAAPRGGAASVHPEDTLGAVDLCWCGLPVDHMWPGRTVGAKHPKKEAMKTMTAHVDRRDLRAYHRTLQDFLVQCINEDQLRFRISKNSVILYPPDNSQPMTVHARNTDRQVRSLAKWYLDHVRPEDSTDEPEGTVEEVSPEAIEALAEVTNDPAEHPQKRIRKVEDVEIPDDRPPVAPEPSEPSGEWVVWVRREGGPSDNIEARTVGDITQYRCKWCVDTDHPFLTESNRSIGGHNRVYHTDTSTLYGPEARARATETNRFNALHTKVMDLTQLLAEAVGMNLGPNTALEGRVEDLEQQLADATKRADDAEARIRLMQEAFKGLE